MNTEQAEKLLTVASSLGLLVELKNCFQNRPKYISLRSGIKLSFFSGVMLWMYYKWLKRRRESENPQNRSITSAEFSAQFPTESNIQMKVLFGSVTGKAKYFANEFYKKCQQKGYKSCTVIDLKNYDPEDSLMNDLKSNVVLIIFISTYTDGTPPESAAWFYKYVTEMACDFRFQKDALKGLNYSICGLGNSLYVENFNKVAIELDKCFSSLQATRIAPLYCCDENTIKSKHSSLEGDVEYWQNNFFEKLQYFDSQKNNSIEEKITSCCKNNDSTKEETACCKSNKKEVNGQCCSQNGHDEEANNNDQFDSTDEDEEEDEEEEGNYFSDIDDELDEENSDMVKIKKQKNGLIDMEDLGTVMSNMKKKKNTNSEPKEMITPLLRKSLEKQGYKLIGTHSGVKLVII